MPTNNNLSLPENTELIIVSDIHMRTAVDERAELLLQVVDAAKKGQIKKFLLLGDIFDFCFGESPYFQSKFQKIGDALSGLAASGTEVTFFEGNHEFHVGGLPWHGINLVPRGSQRFHLSDGRSLIAEHGDLMYSTKGYRLFRAFLKSSFVKFIASVLPARLLDAYAISHARVSRASDSYRGLDHESLLDAAERWLGEHDIGVFGHFHTPYYVPLTGKGTLISVHDWAKPNFLCYGSGEFTRFYFESEWRCMLAEEFRTYT